MLCLSGCCAHVHIVASSGASRIQFHVPFVLVQPDHGIFFWLFQIYAEYDALDAHVHFHVLGPKLVPVTAAVQCGDTLKDGLILSCDGNSDMF